MLSSGFAKMTFVVLKSTFNPVLKSAPVLKSTTAPVLKSISAPVSKSTSAQDWCYRTDTTIDFNTVKPTSAEVVYQTLISVFKLKNNKIRSCFSCEAVETSFITPPSRACTA